jgi:dTDP-4-dehydrorhamnose reductase
MNILLLGNNGQVGFELQRALAPLGTVTSLDFPEVDFLNLDQLAALVRKHNPEVIVNPAAYTAVDKAEPDSATAHAINGAAVGILAAQAKQLNALLVHNQPTTCLMAAAHALGLRLTRRNRSACMATAS